MRRLFWLLLGVVGGLIFVWLVLMKLVARLAARLGHSEPCPAALSWLVDNPYRHHYIGPILERVGIGPGERVLELGPGPGAFTGQAAGRVGPDGQLFALDIQPKMMAQVARRVREAGLGNVMACIADAHHLPLSDASLDRAFLVTVLPEIPDPDLALAELRRVLGPGGVLSVTEEFWDPDFLFAFETIRHAEGAGFRVDRRFGNVWRYTINFRGTPPGQMVNAN